MAIVLEVSLTLNPVNQIAYLADLTSLVDGTEYVINATYLQNDTRFTFHGNLDIALTKPPQGVPGPGTVVPAEITTVPLAATPPPPVTYPFSTKDRLDASNLNLTFEFDPGPVPPHSALGGAGRYKYWVDTSTTPATIRQCVVARASVTYVANQWVTVGTVDPAGFKVSGVLPLTGGTLSGGITINSAFPTLALSKPVSGSAAQVVGYTGANARWNVVLGDSTAESGGNTGSNFQIGRWSDAGVAIDSPLSINRATGLTTISSLNLGTSLTVANGGTGAINAPAALANLGGVAKAGDTMTGNLQINGGSIYPQTDATGILGVSTNRWGSVYGVQFHADALIMSGGIQYPNYGLTSPATNIGFGYSYSTAYLWVVPNGVAAGPIAVNTSDERLKRDIRPISVDPLAMLRRVQLKAFNQVSTRNDPADGVHPHDVGFIAQQLQQIIPDAVIEPPPEMENAYLGLDLMPLVAYCVGAIQQLAARLEALEGA